MKKILYVLLGLVAVYLILCLIGPSEIKVERSITINASAVLIKSKITDLKFFHETWSPWTEKDPNMIVTYTGEMGKEGSSMAWKSDVKDVGVGSLTYMYTHGDTVMQTLHFDGHSSDANIYHVVTPNGADCKVIWIMQDQVPFVFRPMMLFMNMDKMLGPDFENGLAKLKVAMESMPAETAVHYDVQEINWDAKTFYGKKETLSFDKMSVFFATTYPKLFADLAATKHEMIGQPKAIYFSFDEKTMVTECAAVLEVPKGVALKNWEKFETPATKVLLIEYYGAYDKSANAHYAMDTYMKEKGLTQSYVIEEYVTDPMEEKDTAKWLTNIFYLTK